MYSRAEDFKVLCRDDHEYDHEHALPRGGSRYSRGFVALLLLLWITAATLFGSIVVLWNSGNAGQAWICKSGKQG